MMEKIEIFLQENEHYIYHTFEFKAFIEEAFNCKYNFITGVKHGKVKVMLPICLVKSKMFGDKVISSSYIEYGGFAGDISLAKDLIKGLQDKFGSVDYLEIRGNIHGDKGLEFLQKESLYKRFVLSLDSLDNVWKGIQKSKRKAVKKSLKYVDVRSVEESDLDKFYNLYLRNMREFGSPPYSKKYFISFYKHLVSKGFGKIYGAYIGDKLVSALLGFTYRDRVHILIAVSDSEYQGYRANDAVHWEFIKWAVENKYKYFDFCSVRDEVPVVDPNSKKFKIMTSVWKKLPLKVTEVMGMKLRKELGI